VWVEQADALEQLAAGRLGEPLCGEYQRYIFPVIREPGQDRKRLVW
jgi:hypothetical protein